MTSDKQWRVATAVGFLAGLMACLHALRDCPVTWPPDAVWEALSRPQQLELSAGIVLGVVSLVVSLATVRHWESP